MLAHLEFQRLMNENTMAPPQTQAGELLGSYPISGSRHLRDPDFAAWLTAEYVPIAGGWQY
jgi:hypothetical protein